MLAPSELEDSNNQQNNISPDDLRFQLITSNYKDDLVVLLAQRLRPFIIEEVKSQLEKNQLVVNCKKCNCGKQSAGTSESRSLQLKFLGKIPSKVFTGEKIQGEGCNSIKVALLDSLTEEVVKSGDESAATVELMVLEGDADVTDFINNIAGVPKGEKSVLKGPTYLKLQQGIGEIGDISFIHNSDWKKTRELRFGARVIDYFHGTTIKPTKTEPFILKDKRMTYYMKKYPPSLSDQVWSLEKVGSKGALRKRLTRENITTVKDFLKLLFMNPQKLKNIVNVNVKAWEVITNHAMTCVIDDVVHLYYYPDSQPKTGVVFNVVGQVKGLVKDSQYIVFDKLSEKEKGDAQKLVVDAFGDWLNVNSFDNENRLMESFCHSSESPRPERANGCNLEPASEMNTQAGTSSQVIVPSIRCTGESSNANMDFIEELLDVPGGGSYPRPCSPDFPYWSHYFYGYQHQQLLNLESHILCDEASPHVLLVGSGGNSVNPEVQKRWRKAIVLLVAIGRTIGTSEKKHAHKKLRVS